MTDPRSNPSNPSQSSTAEWERLSTLFEAAQSLPPESRERYLDAVCAENPALRAELKALLASASDAPAFLQHLATNVVAPVFERVVSAESAPHVDEAPPPVSLSGTQIRHYRVLQRLGGGGMGVVYLGRDTRLERDVALKFLAPTRFADEHSRRQLVREAQAVSTLDDPHVCAIHAIEDTDDGGICLVMAYCAGGTLRERLRHGLPSVNEGLRIATQIASGLACAHRSGIVHRDLKPANIGFADRDVARILDFGVAARTMGHATTGLPSLAGTLPYMAPEVLRGEPPDVRADVWALGVTLYELLTGRRPFTGPTDASVLYAILEQEAVALDRPDGVMVPDTVVRLVRDLLQKDPGARPADGNAVLERLAAISAHDVSASNSAVGVAREAVGLQVAPAVAPATARIVPPSTQGATRPLARGGTVAAAAAGFLLMAVAGWWGLSRRALDATPPEAGLEVARSSAPIPTVAVLPFTVQGNMDWEYLREGMVDLLTPAFDATGLLRGVDPNAVIGADTRSVGNTERDARIDSVTAQQWATRVGASRYVIGAVVSAGQVLTLRATMYASTGEERGRAQAEIADASALGTAADGLVRQLVSAELRAPGDTLAALAASTTRSSPALRAYLDGERELRDARPAAAVGHFQQAVAVDPSFAVAWYRLARAAKWSEVDSLNRVATARAFALSPSLPPRLQSIVRAYHEMRAGNPRVAERDLRQIVADYPTDVEAWMLLGEVLFDNNSYYGRPSNEATAAFRTVMSLDPRNREVTVYLMELAARANRSGELDTLFTMYFSPNSAGEQPGIRQTYLALHARRIESGASKASPRAAAAQRSNAVLTDPASALIALRRAGSSPPDLLAAKSFAHTVSAVSNSAPSRLEGLLSLASLYAAEGRLDSAALLWQAANQIDPVSTMVAQALAAIAPDSPVPTDTVRALQARLARRASANEFRGIGVDTAILSSANQRALLQYLVGLTSMRLGDQGSTNQAVRALTARQASPMASPMAQALAQALRGHQALGRQQYAEAEAAFATANVNVSGRLRAVVPVLQQQADRFARAQALTALGREPEAAAWRGSLRDEPSVWSAPYLARK